MSMLFVYTAAVCTCNQLPFASDDAALSLDYQDPPESSCNGFLTENQLYEHLYDHLVSHASQLAGVSQPCNISL